MTNESTMTVRLQDPGPGTLAALLLTAAIFIGTAAVIGAAGCGPVREAAREAVSSTIDCTVGNAAELAPYVIPFAESVLRAATQPDGRVDWSQLRALLTRSTDGHAYEPGRPLPAGIEVVSCAIAAAVMRSRAPASIVARTAVDPGFEGLRAEVLGGRSFKTAQGTL